MARAKSSTIGRSPKGRTRRRVDGAGVTKLSVNLNKIALLRYQRRHDHPDLLRAAHLAIRAGAHGITVHPRLDQRHIRRRDVVELAAMLSAGNDQIELNVEDFPSEAFFELIGETRPTQTTLVPDAPDALTSDHGWNIAANVTDLRASLERLKSYGTRTALFVDAQVEAVVAASDVGADRIELFTGPFATAFATTAYPSTVESYVAAADTARRLGLGVNAGHDLTQHNLTILLRAIPWLDEVSIGHYLTVDALSIGLEAAVAAYVEVIEAES